MVSTGQINLNPACPDSKHLINDPDFLAAPAI
jgi:hypothetical protein